MASTYTANSGLEKPAPGDQAGSWGSTVNTNLDLIDEALNGIVTVTLASAGDSGSPNTLDISDGISSDGRNVYVEIDDGGDLGASVYLQLTPDDAQKVIHIKNSLTTQDLYVFQGTYNASRDYVISNGNTAMLKFSGAGATASTVENVNQNMQMEGTVTAASYTGTFGGVSVVKQADETVTSSTTLQDDDELLFSAEASTVYHFRLAVMWNAHATPDFKVGWSVPSGTTMKWTKGSGSLDMDETDTTFEDGDATDKLSIYSGAIYVDSTAGNVTFQWAQNTSNGNDTKVLKGSLLTVWS